MPRFQKTVTSLFFAVVAAVFCSSTIAQTSTDLEEAKKHVGETVMICGTIISIKHLENVKDKPTLINLGNVTQHLDVVIGTDTGSLSNLSSADLQYKDACVSGKIYYFKGTNHIYLKAESITLKDKQIIASPIFKEKEPEQVSTPEVLSATKKSGVRKKIVLSTKVPSKEKNALLIKYIKIGKIVSYKQKKDKKTYVILLKEYKKS